jgi:hypothetical protein
MIHPPVISNSSPLMTFVSHNSYTNKSLPMLVKVKTGEKKMARTKKENVLNVLGELQTKITQRRQSISNVLQEIPPKRGGHREGAGRPLLGDAPTSERVIFRLTKEQSLLLQQKTEEGESPNQAARRILLKTLAEKK